MKYIPVPAIRILTALLILIVAIQFDFKLVQVNDNVFEFDYVIVGAGTAGCVVAGLLASKSNYSVLLVEAGDYFNVFTQIPITTTLLQGSKYDWSLKTEPQMYSSFGMFNQTQAYPRGKGLGGSGQLNYLVHMEPSLYDYDAWKSQNITSWNYQTMHPFFLKLKSLIHIVDNNVLESGVLQTAFRKVTKAIKNLSVEVTQSTIFQGKRWSSFDGYLKPFLRSKNLHILLNTEVTKILFTKNRAVGISTRSKNIPRIYFRKEGILCAGVVHTPQILLRSGIGPQKDLEKLNITTLSNLNGVGENLFDHLNTPLFVSIEKPFSVTAVKILSLFEIWKYVTQKKGFFAHLPIVGSGKTLENQTFILFGMGSTDEVLLREIGNYKQETFRNLFPLYFNISQEGFVLLSSCLRPKSRGTIKLSTDYKTKINPNYLESSEDITCMIKALRISEKIINSRQFQSLGAKIHWPKFQQCELFAPLSSGYLECIIRVGSLTGYHPGGTCRMGHDSDSVVNENLEVIGVQGLRIIDASIMPSPIVHFPNSFIIAIAHRAVSLILNITDL